MIATSDASNSKSKPSVKDLFSAVETRFDTTKDSNPDEKNVLPDGSTREHYNILSSTISPDLNLNEKTNETIKKLQDIQSKNELSNLKTSKANQKAQEILMKKHAKGDLNISYEDRIYLTCVLPHLSELYVFYHREKSIQDLLWSLCRLYPQGIFQSSHKPDDMSVVLYTDDTNDWRLWDHRWKLCDVFHSFESVFIVPMSMDEIVSVQQGIQSKTLIADSTVETFKTSNESLATGQSPPEETVIISEADRYKPGELLLYTTSSGSTELVTIIAVHLDDYPHVYYTVLPQVKDSNTPRNERQTYHKRLSRINPVSDTSKSIGMGQLPISMGGVSSTPFSIQISHGNKTYYIIDISDSTTIGQLKVKLQESTGISWQKMKLISKGTILKDHMAIQSPETKIVNGGKVAMIGSS